MTTMQLAAATEAVAISSFGGPEVLVPCTIPMPAFGDDDVLVAVDAAGVNRPDVSQRLGNYPPPPGASEIPGLEIAGRVVAAGKNVTTFGIGDAVCALVPGGGYARHAAVAAANALPVPAGFTMIEAAAIPETFFTVWTNVFDRGRLKAGESLLVHGGASGIGTTAIALAKACGARVFATASNAEKVAACEALGAERCIDYKHVDYVAAVHELTAGKGVDVVLDIVGGDYLDRNLEVLAIEGRLVQIGVLGGARAAINLHVLMRKRLSVVGSTLRPRPVADKAKIARAVHEHVWPLFEAGMIRPLIYRTFPLADAAGAHRLMDANAIVGKVVLTTA
jgi:putative PIG3 family NAD(P)H quinone oxidoreductase